MTLLDNGNYDHHVGSLLLAILFSISLMMINTLYILLLPKDTEVELTNCPFVVPQATWLMLHVANNPTQKSCVCM